jgi:hypothetical protein
MMEKWIQKHAPLARSRGGHGAGAAARYERQWRERVVGVAGEIEIGVCLDNDRIKNDVERRQEIQRSGCSQRNRA